MPKAEIDYLTTPIQFYQLICKDKNVEDNYVGHTVSWRRRKNRHKSNCNNESSDLYNLKVYQIIRENGGFGNWIMIEIHKQFCSDIRESERIEQGLIDKHNANMNTNRTFLTDEQRVEQQRRCCKNYRQKHLERLKENDRNYVKLNEKKLKQRFECPCGGHHTFQNKTRHYKNCKKHLDYEASLLK